MILAISGKIGSGKDTVGHIIQRLTVKNIGIDEQEIAQEIRYNNKAKLDNRMSKLGFSGTITFEIVKFADALKDIVCILTGCTREQLEDIDFKNSHLSKEWLNIKQTLDDGRIIKDDSYIMSYRGLLQKLGTNLLRNQLHENVWVNALFSKYKTTNLVTKVTKNNNPIIGSIDHEYKQYDYPNWIITDCRFSNEAKAIKDRNGIVIRVNRNKIHKTSKDYGIHVHEEMEKQINGEHESETALDNYKFDHIIDNNGTIENLIYNVKDILIKEKIL